MHELDLNKVHSVLMHDASDVEDERVIELKKFLLKIKREQSMTLLRIREHRASTMEDERFIDGISRGIEQLIYTIEKELLT